jgi:hypothetical protein
MATKLVLITFGHQLYSGLMVIKPLFGCHMAAINSIMLVGHWMAIKKFGH